MNTNHLKKFAQSARRKLLSQVAAKLNYVLTQDTAELREQAAAIKNLKVELERIGEEQLVEKVSYIWFNRLMALRFMDANDYQPGGIRIVSARDGESLPEILQEAKQGGLTDPEWKSKMRIVNDILDGKLKSKNPQNEAYHHLLVGACNQLSRQFPFLFEQINDYAELLLPDDLTSEFSIVYDVVEGMNTEDCAEVEIIGWLYQFYISEKKDEISGSKGNVQKEDIPAATQLFTPRWIVEYMVQNTLGKLWLMNNPSSNLRDHMEYFIESPLKESDDYLVVERVEDIDFLDQACGSGHILVYAFELFSKIYEEQGYTSSEIPKLIIEKNLTGFEIDDRAAQLAGFALMMKARQYHRRVFSKDIKPYIVCFTDHSLNKEEVANTFSKLNIELSKELADTIDLMRQATNLGSLIVPEGVDDRTHEKLYLLLKNTDTSDAFLILKVNTLLRTIRQLIPMTKSYHCIVDNPPYMGGGRMNKPLANFVKKNYKDSKADLMACFMEAGLGMLLPLGYLGMINQHTWMFNTRYQNLRIKLLSICSVKSMIHLGSRAFKEIGGEKVKTTAFVLSNSIKNQVGKYYKLDSFKKPELKKKELLKILKNNSEDLIYVLNQNNFSQIPETKYNYWFDSNAYTLFRKMKPLSEFSEKRLGLCTGNNVKYIRYWFEIKQDDIDRLSNSHTEFIKRGKKFALHNKGGSFKRWYGNQNQVIKFDALNYKELANSCNKLASKSHYFKECLSWSELSTARFGVRYYPEGFVFNIKGPSIFFQKTESISYFNGLLNSKVFNYLVQGLSNSMSINGGDVEMVPIPDNDTEHNKIVSLVDVNVEIAKFEEKVTEVSLDFIGNIVTFCKGDDLDQSLDYAVQMLEEKLSTVYSNVSLINLHFSSLYNFERNDFTTISYDELTVFTNIRKKDNSNTIDKVNLVKDYLSYIVGCILGRFSLEDEGGLVSLTKDTSIISSLKFKSDGDGIIPFLNDEWFEDDIIGEINRYLKVEFGESNLSSCISTIELHLNSSLRTYMVRRFYIEHIKRYNTRPIYWMFSSPKGHFRVLVYLHRYTPDTLNNILNDYLRDFIQKLEAQKQHYQQLQETGSTSEQTKAIKEIDRLDKMILDCQEYEREILYPLATERIAIDLDDGVLVNYNKFGKAVETVAGLNDAKAKKKVRGFDWIDVEQIRD